MGEEPQARYTEMSWRSFFVKLKETGRYDFRRGVKDPCVYRCLKTGIVVVHHIDDGRCAGDAAALDRLLDEDLCAHCEITTGPLEAKGVSVEVLGKTKTRLPGCILTAPDPKHPRTSSRPWA